MRPLRLEMTAFGPYAETQAIDFTRLQGRNLFLIHGPTGSGKTTILDAITFALYGESSGAERDGRGMRSDRAAPGRVTEVTLEFAVGARRYRARRSPEQERPRVRGEGTRLQPAEAELCALGAETETTGTVAGVRRVTEEVERLLGFNAAQFRQVVLLPQGQFRTLLVAPSSEREKILETLFDTQACRRIQEELKERERSLAAGVREFAIRRQTLLDQAHAGGEAELRERRLELAAAAEHAANAVAELREREAAAGEALRLARGIADVLTEKAAAEATVREIVGREAEMALVRREVEGARLADRARPAAEVRDRVLVQLERADGEARERAGAKEVAQRAHAQADKVLSGERERECERELLRQRLSELTALEAPVSALVGAREILRAAEAAFEEAQAQAAAAQARLDGCRDRLEQAEVAWRSIEESCGQAEGLRSLAEAARQAADWRERLLRVEAQLAAEEAALAAAEERAAARQAAWRSACEELSQAQRAWRDEQAGALAASLVPGESCPVCGSREHPAPAHPAQAPPQEVELRALDERAAGLQAEWEAALHERSTGRESLGGLRREAESLAVLLAGKDGAPVGELRREAEGREAALARCREAQERRPAAQAVLMECRESQEATRLQLAQAEGRLAEAQSGLEVARAELAACEGRVPAGLRDSEGLGRAQKATQSQLSELLESLQLAETDERLKRQALSQAAALHEAAQQTAASTASLLQDSSDNLRSLLRDLGFPDEVAFTAALRATEALTSLQERLRAYDDALTAAKDRLERAEAAAVYLKMPDLAGLDAAAAAARSDLEEAQARLTHAGRDLEQVGSWLTELEELGREAAAEEARYRLFGRLSQVAGGANAYNISFQRFVLGAMLEHVLVSANERLGRMSNGRFSLERARESADRRRAAGLDLQVADAYTGTSRPVASLSGGESFLAALALALGLADVVQAYAGGVRLETVFIDEGFGSLDPEALDAAVEVLMRLQEKGRLVGVISHVPELKERIDVRLEILAGRAGSQAELRVP